MGQKLSCVSKKKQHEDDITKPRKTKGKLATKITVTEASEECVKPVEVAAVNEAVPTTVNHVQTEAQPEVVRRKARLVIMKPAPATAQVPVPLTPIALTTGESIKPPLDKTSFGKLRKMDTAAGDKIYNPQPVDQASRELAQGEARPATWSDLYWALIGQRNFRTDEEKVRAIFSWLCSIPLDQDAFLTHEELDEAIKSGIEFAKEAKKAKSKSPSPDSPEVVVNDLTRGKSTYLRAFESLCRYSNIPCCAVKGLAKGVDYAVGMKLVDQVSVDSPESSLTRLHHAWSAAYMDGKWALFDAMWAAERLAMSANVRLSQIAQAGRMDYETDMFYFNADPAKFIYSHYPFNEEWQLLNPPMSFKEFQDSVLLKPAFFTYGLGLFSHREGVIQVQNKLILKLSIPRSLVNVLLFTFNLKLDGRDEMFDGVNLSRFGMHEISLNESLVIFSFRFPKCGAYKLTIYARKKGDPLFTDICEYRVEAGATDSGTESENRGSINLPPFPPTSQSNYGPTEKATELKIKTVVPNLEAQCKSATGVFEIRFTSSELGSPLPKLTARLKSLLYDAAVLIDCLLIRNTEAPMPTTMTSLMSQGSTAVGASVPMVVITAYLPAAGEYAMEVYGAPPDADENASYFLVWQLLIDAECGVKLSTPLRKRLATADLGPKDETWNNLGLRTVSHPDPLIQVPTVTSINMQKTKSKSELIQQYVAQTERKERLQKQQQEELREDQKMKNESVRSDESSNGPDKVDQSSKTDLVDEQAGPRSCDLQIVLEKPANKHLCIVGQLVDISEAQEEDRTTYLLQQPEELDEAEASARTTERIIYLIRIPKGDHFYKFFLYAAPVDSNLAMSLPLVYTYLIEAPQRLMASEVPYIGVTNGPFREKLEQQQKHQTADGQ
ncbi:Ubiquitin protein ligase BRE1 [Fasciola hepatica]|uniref:Ubiquitin protein ligase BRE1 n=1 Tax=Fasciola hepatica TaxID=6192 RepID=A0A4E0S1I9_FASHE|nr:Ubiquitin protein ligase BRE1 [Fasciola hepatica]